MTKGMRRTLVVSMAVVFSLAHCLAQTREDEETAIKALIQKAYVGGAYNDDDSAAIKEGFHEALTVHHLHHQGLSTYSVRQWTMQLDHMKRIRPTWNKRTTADITVLSIEGNAAVARVDIFNNQVPELTDFLSLYKFTDGWKVISRIFARHALPDEVRRERLQEWEERVNEVWNPPDKVIEAIGVKTGMVIGEVGAGRGRYTLPLARRVGKTGKVYANDINETSLSTLRERCRENGIANVETILGKEDDPLLPEQALDMIIMAWVFHHLDEPAPLLKNLKASLKAGAPVVMVEPKDSEIDMEKEAFGVKVDPNRPTLRERIETAAAEAGLELKLIRMEVFLPRDDIYILKVKI